MVEINKRNNQINQWINQFAHRDNKVTNYIRIINSSC